MAVNYSLRFNLRIIPGFATAYPVFFYRWGTKCFFNGKSCYNKSEVTA